MSKKRKGSDNLWWALIFLAFMTLELLLLR